MEKKVDTHYFHDTAECYGKKDFGPSATLPNQGFRLKDLIMRMTAGAPPPVGRNPIYMDTDHVDPTATWGLDPIEMAEKARQAAQELNMLRNKVQNEYQSEHQQVTETVSHETKE